MSVNALVTDTLTSGFAEVALLDEDGRPGDERFIASYDKKMKVRRDDIVELTEQDSRIMKESLWAYIIPPICFVYAVLVTKNLGWGERILSGFIVGFMAFIISWIFNRRSRMLKKQKYRVVRIVKKGEFNLL